MNTDWKDYLLNEGAKYDKDGLFSFNETISDEQHQEVDDIICDLSYFSTVVIAGGDATEFMQGQFTSDVEKLNGNLSQISGFCNNKGRMIANFRLFQHQSNHFISVRSDLVEASIDHLQHYVMRAEVALQDVSEQMVHLGISGKNSVDLLSPFIGELSTDIDSVSHNDNYIAIRVPGSTPRYEVFCSSEHAKTLWKNISEKANMVSSEYWNYLNIQNGLPFIDNNTSEEFVPQMANMELIGGISFEKGCYTGQEIVARTHYLGKQKRRTYHIEINSTIEPKPGEQLATDSSTDNQYIGTLISVYPVATNRFEALAVIQIKSAEEDTLKLKNSDAEITLLELPYSFEYKG